MMYLKQSTASQSVLIGPFVDDTDGKTAETGLTIANTDIRLSANGGNMAAKNSGGGTHDEAGWYTITLDATDTATVGRLQLSVHVAGALPVWHEFWVLEEAIYDALFGASATGLLPANMTQIEGTDATDVIDARLAAIGLDHLISASVSGSDVADDSIIAKLVSKEATADWDDFVNTTDSLQAIRDRGDADWTSGGSDPAILQNTTIATLASQTSFTLTAGSEDDDAYNGCLIVVTDQSTSTQKAVGVVSDYTGSSKTVTLLNDPGIFTMAVGDTVDIIADRSLKPATDNRTLTVDASGEVTLADNVTHGGTSAALSLSRILVTTTGSTHSIELAGSGSGDGIAFTRSGAGDAFETNFAAALQSETNDALVAQNLDHLCAQATASADMTTEVVDNSILSRILAAGDTSDFDPSTDGLQPLRDHIGDGTNLTEAGGTGDHLSALATAANVLAAGDIDGFSLEESQKLILSALVGILTGADGTSISIKAADGSTTRITMTVDAYGNRSSPTLDASG